MVRILFVEDNRNAALAAKTMLELRGYAVDAAETVAEANDRAAGNRYDVLVSDLALPDGSGEELAVRLGLPAIALSGYITSSDREGALANGFRAFLAKPYHVEDLIAEIERARTTARV